MGEQRIHKLIVGIFLLAVLLFGAWLYSVLYQVQAQDIDKLIFVVEPNESVAALALRLEQEQVIKSAWLFRKYLVWKGIDKEIQAGQFTVEAPVTLARVVAVLQARATQEERAITVIPGWDMRDIAGYLDKENVAHEKDVIYLLGEPAIQDNETSAKIILLKEYQVLRDKPDDVSLEGYLAPDTYRIFTNASLESVLEKLIAERDSQFTEQMYGDIKRGGRTVHEILTMASILEREVQHPEDRAKVADLFWRRYNQNWALQADSTVHYAVGKKGNVFTTSKDRESKNHWNTYQYPGLPPGPISNPNIESIRAAIYPEKNEYWYFLTTVDGEVKYGRTLEEHNGNVARYLR